MYIYIYIYICKTTRHSIMQLALEFVRINFVFGVYLKIRKLINRPSFVLDCVRTTAIIRFTKSIFFIQINYS